VVCGVVIDAERVTLRNWREGDAEAFIRHTNTPAVMRWLGGVKEPADLLRLVNERFIPWQEQQGFTFWVVERKADGAFLGICGLKIAQGADNPTRGAIEIGWRFREDSWGQGYATEAAKAALAYAFDELASARVVALTVEGNDPSARVAERIGMTRRHDLDYVEPSWPDSMNPVAVFEICRESEP
jgi:RimJ/RimL family protein N-acetyltransferase